MRPLIEGASTLDQPRGICIDQGRSRLYVCDAGAASRKIYYYDLHVAGTELKVVSEPRVAVQDIESRWCSVDGTGNLYFSEESSSRILKVRSQHLEGDVDLANAPVEKVYSGAKVSEVSNPGAVAVDNFEVFWTNKAYGLAQGSVVKAAQEPELLSGLLEGVSQKDYPGGKYYNVKKIARNTGKAYGICLTDNEVFFTDTESKVYGVRKGGGPITTVSDMLTHPRGC